MRVGKKLFPYPVFNKDVFFNSFKNSSFKLKYDVSQDDINLCINNVYIDTENAKIKELYEDGTIKIALIVECSATVYRETFSIGFMSSDITIATSNFRDKVIISSYAYATKDFVYSDDDFLDDYEGNSFNIEKYDILGIDDGFSVRINYDETKDKKVSSIFLVISDSTIDNNVVKYGNNGNKIIIKLPEKQFSSYYNLSQNEYFQNMFFSILAIPALSYYLFSFKAQELDIDTIINDNIWFKSVCTRYKEIHGKELTDEIFANINSNELAQELLNDATVGSIDDIFMIAVNNAKGLVDEDE